MSRTQGDQPSQQHQGVDSENLPPLQQVPLSQLSNRQGKFPSNIIRTPGVEISNLLDGQIAARTLENDR